MDKKAKAEAKRARRTQRKLGGDENESLETQDVDFDGSDVDAEASDTATSDTATSNTATSDTATSNTSTSDGGIRTQRAEPTAPNAPDTTN